ncbi:TetR/AcrR family transcriptional regulator [Jiella sp. M17.18]|uniref:TetR/AcrR family transcriptional regulator n=1 Tax=Jiella sp. M17.18 TaxID=3234247 RepID=UPI0034DF11DC
MQKPEAADEADEAGASPRPLRADARRNRDKLTAAAAKAFARSGVDASLEAIAREAGVGTGTLYRHFPTREALIEAVYRREVEGLVAAADDLLRQETPDAALAEWMQRYVDYIATKRGMRDSLKLLLESNSPLFAETHGLVPRTFRRLMEQAVQSGTIRPDADSADVLHALSSIYSATDGPDWHERSRRLVALIMDGLRYGAPRPSQRR